jgi:serine/threonine-protein kinase HipA
MRELVIWMNGERVGRWSVGTAGNHRFQYDQEWLANPRVRQISLSLPCISGPVTGDKVRNYFDNLLPDAEGIRRRIGSRHKIKNIDAFNLLQAIGRDCVGAVQLLPACLEPTGWNKLQYEPMLEAQVEQHINRLGDEMGTEGADVEDDFRLSIAGAQEKTALLKVGDQWCRPLGATPTTHILKPPIGITPGRNLDMRQSVENEWLCNRILHELKLPAANCEIADFGSKRVLVIERFDRQTTEQGWIARLPQEDLCQSKGVASTAKYEQQGGPGIAECLDILRGGENFQRDGRTFLCAQLLFWFLGAIDGHAKNFSIFLLPQGRYRLAPLYDVLSAWPLFGGTHGLQYKKVKLAMSVRATSAHYRLAEIQRRHWEQLAMESGVDDAWSAMLDLAQRLGPALNAVEGRLPVGFPVEMAQKVFIGARQHLARFNQI